jgi:hypothetical protein
MPVTKMTTVRVRHASERFYHAIDMFYDNSPARQPFVIRFFTSGQLMLLTRLYWNKAISMIIFYAQISKISIKLNGITHQFPYSIFIHLKIMFAAFRFLHVKDFKTLLLYNNLCFQCVTFFLPE